MPAVKRAAELVAAQSVTLADKRVLHVDPILTVREMVRAFLNPLGCDLHEAESAGQALGRIAANKYDLIVCDYALGEGPDGQTLLDKVRREALVPRTTIFFILTTERAYRRVAQVVELAPDEYLLKPFSLKELDLRLRLQLARVATLRPALEALTRLDYAAALAAALPIADRHGAHHREAQRLVCEALIGLGRHDEARTLLDGVLEGNPMPVRWAAWERARLERDAGDLQLARKRLIDVAEAFPHFVAPKDELGALAAKDGDANAAHLWASRAVAVSATPERFRRLGFAELDLGNADQAESAFREAIEASKTSFYGDSADYALTAHAALEQGARDRAQQALASGRSRLIQSAASRVLLPLLGAQLAPSAEQAAEELRKAQAELAALGPDHLLAPNIEVLLADYLIRAGDFDGAIERLQRLQEHTRLDRLHEQRVAALLAKAGYCPQPADAAVEHAAQTADQAAAEAIEERAIELNNEAVRLMREGSLDAAVQLLEEAVEEMPKHTTLLANLVNALLRRHASSAIEADLDRADAVLAQARTIVAFGPSMERLASTLAARRGATGSRFAKLLRRA